MHALTRTLHAERLKVSHTLAFWLCLLTPLLAALFGLLVASTDTTLAALPDAHSRWRVVILREFAIWSRLFLPLMLTVEAVLLAALEHGNNTWKQLLALPLPRHTHFLAKLCMLLILGTLATVLLSVLTYVADDIVAPILIPALSQAGAPPVALIMGCGVITLIAACSMMALLTTITLRCTNFTTATAIGIACWCAGLLLPDTTPVSAYYPWSMAYTALQPGYTFSMVWINVVAVVVLAWLGAMDFNRHARA